MQCTCFNTQDLPLAKYTLSHSVNKLSDFSPTASVIQLSGFAKCSTHTIRVLIGFPDTLSSPPVCSGSASKLYQASTACHLFSKKNNNNNWGELKKTSSVRLKSPSSSTSPPHKPWSDSSASTRVKVASTLRARGADVCHDPFSSLSTPYKNYLCLLHNQKSQISLSPS